MTAAVQPRNPTRLGSLDALRAFGAVWVVVTHVAYTTGTLTGTVGGLLARDFQVAIFFMLSGFLLFLPYVQAKAAGGRRPGTAGYVWRRAVRILPAYWVVIAVGLTVLPEHAQATSADWLRYGTLTQVYADSWTPLGLSHTWTLAAGAASYLILPALAAVALGRRWRPVRSLAITVVTGLTVTVAWLVAMGLGYVGTDLRPPWLTTYEVWFCAGMALAVAYVAIRTGAAPRRWSVLDAVASSPGSCWIVALGLLAIASTPIAGPRGIVAATPGELAASVGLFLAAAFMIFIPAAFGPANRYKTILSHPVVAWLGAISYGIFLWHPLVLEGIYRLTDRPVFTGALLPTVALTLAGSIALAALSYHLLERPLRLWARRFPRDRPDDGGEPEAGEDGKPGDLRPGGPVAVGHGERQPGADEQRDGREPQLKRA